jgi:hypothetical protein
MMDRDRLLVQAADAVLRHTSDYGAVQAATRKGLTGDDAELADNYAFALTIMREELGEAAVRQVRDRHARAGRGWRRARASA